MRIQDLPILLTLLYLLVVTEILQFLRMTQKSMVREIVCVSERGNQSPGNRRQLKLTDTI